MRGAPQGLCNGAHRALHRVFVSPAALGPPMMGGRRSGMEHPRPRLFTRPSRPPPSGAGGGSGRGGGYARAAAASNLGGDDEPRGFDKRYTTQEDIERTGRDRPPQDNEIKDPYIMVVDGGPPRGPLATGFVILGLKAGKSLRMVQPFVPADAEAGRPRAQLALCKVVNKRDEYTRQRQLKEQRRAVAAADKGKSKGLDLSWSIGEHDLAIKLRQLAKFLAKGVRVEVKVERKRGGKKATPEEAAALVKRVREAVEEQGGRENGAAVGEMLKTLKLAFESKGSS